MSTTSEPTRDGQCALWYFRYGAPHYEVCDTEQEAARSGVGIEDAGEGSVVGVQFPDGSFVRRDDWTAYNDEEKRQSEMYRAMARESASRPKPATREIAAPWDASHSITVEADAPSWLGLSRPPKDP